MVYGTFRLFEILNIIFFSLKCFKIASNPSKTVLFKIYFGVIAAFMSAFLFSYFFFLYLASFVTSFVIVVSLSFCLYLFMPPLSLVVYLYVFLCLPLVALFHFCLLMSFFLSPYASFSSHVFLWSLFVFVC